MKIKKDTNHLENQKSFLDQYKQVYALYNQATRLIKEENLDSAELILKELFNDNSNLEIPIEIYKTYILLLLTNKKEKAAGLFLANAPDEIKYSGEMLQIQQKYNLSLIEKKKKEYHFLSKKMILIVSSLLLVVAIIYGALKLNLFTHANQAESKVSSLKKEIKLLENDRKSITQKLEEANQKLSKKAAEDNAMKEKTTTQSNTQNNHAIKMDFTNEAVQAFEKGYEFYKVKQFESASVQFKKSYSLNNRNYTSDDALYYLILIKQKAHKQNEYQQYVTEFINQQSEFFKESPYLDDVLVMKAEILIKQKNKNEASELLQTIIKKYPKEWSASKAKNLLEGLNK